MQRLGIFTPFVLALAVGGLAVGCAAANGPTPPSVPASRPLAVIASSQSSVASWQLFSTNGGLSVYGMSNDGSVAAQTHMVAVKDHYSAIRSVYPQPAELVTDAKGNLLANSLASAPDARSLVSSMQRDIAAAEKGGVAYGCAGDAITAVGTCLAAAGCGVADVETADIVCIGTFIGCGGSMVALCEDCGICSAFQGRNSQCDDYNYANAHCVECYGAQQCCGYDTCD